jgi:uncharacterized integral membrane protein (TIGR00698 family)
LSSLARIAQYYPGVAAVILIAVTSQFLATHYQAPALVFALLLGMAMNFLYRQEHSRAGVDFCAKHVLRIGVAMLGAGIAVSDIADIGALGLAALIGGMILTIASGPLLAKSLGLGRDMGLLSGGAVAICGVSAALTLSSVMPKNEENAKFTLLAVIMVTTIGALAMVGYPIIVTQLALSPEQAGYFLGGAIHDVSHVAGAGFALSETVGVEAMTVKMVRVAMLIPIAWCFLLLFNRHQGADVSLKPPLFLIGFIALALLNSGGLIPVDWSAALTQLSKLSFLLAIVALGIKTELSGLVAHGWRPVALVLIQSVLLGSTMLLWAVFMI